MSTYVDDRPPLDRNWLHKQLRHLRLWRRFLTQAAVRETHYRAHFVTTLLVGLVQLGLGIVPILLLFGFTQEMHGWSRAEVITLVGAYQIITGLMAAFVAPNLDRMTAYITEGELDAVLLRPVSSQFYLTLRWINVAELTTSRAHRRPGDRARAVGHQSGCGGRSCRRSYSRPVGWCCSRPCGVRCRSSRSGCSR